MKTPRLNSWDLHGERVILVGWADQPNVINLLHRDGENIEQNSGSWTLEASDHPLLQIICCHKVVLISGGSKKLEPKCGNEFNFGFI
jgi:hypothetical protein